MISTTKILQQGFHPLTQKFYNQYIMFLVDTFYQSLEDPNWDTKQYDVDNLHLVHFLQEILNKVIKKYSYIIPNLFSQKIKLDHSKHHQTHKSLSISHLESITFLQFYLRLMFFFYPNSAFFELFASVCNYPDQIVLHYNDKLLPLSEYLRCLALDEIYQIYEDILKYNEKPLEMGVPLLQIKSYNDLVAFIFDYAINKTNKDILMIYYPKYIELMFNMIKNFNGNNITPLESIFELTSHLMDYADSIKFNEFIVVNKDKLSKNLQEVISQKETLLSFIEILNNHKHKSTNEIVLEVDELKGKNDKQSDENINLISSTSKSNFSSIDQEIDQEFFMNEVANQNAYYNKGIE